MRMKTKIMNAAFMLLGALMLGLTWSSCTGRKEAGKEVDKQVITVSIEPLRYFAEAIAGPDWKIETLVPNGASPETYDPTPRQLAQLAQSKACLRIGYVGYELVWSTRLAENAPHVPFMNMSEGIDLIYDSHHAHHHHHEGHPGNYEEQEEEEHHHEAPEAEGGVEPHVWNSPANARIIAGNVLKAMITLDKDHAESYRLRHDSLCQCIDRCDSLIRELLSQPEASEAFMIYHPALSYFARDYGLTQIAIETDGKEPSAARMKELNELCKTNHVKVIFIQPEFDRRNAEAIAKQTGTRIISINPLAYQWEEELIATARALILTPTAQ
ncbi:MAG: metal ABC transporter solute-binding protein, Zn/Mn family [Bacteroides sp.]